MQVTIHLQPQDTIHKQAPDDAAGEFCEGLGHTPFACVNGYSTRAKDAPFSQFQALRPFT
jgi:hypothetical protein